MKNIFTLIILTIFLTSCLKYRDIAPPPAVANTDDIVKKGTIVFNEYLNYGHSDVSEFAGQSTLINNHWVELYNTSNYNISFKSGQWYLTNDFKTPTLFQIPKTDSQNPNGWEIVAYPKGFMRIWCDTLGYPGLDIHASFDTSHKHPGQIGLYYKKNDGTIIMVDTLTYPTNINEKGQSFGRIPDGTGKWQLCTTPTPNAPNQ